MPAYVQVPDGFHRSAIAPPDATETAEPDQRPRAWPRTRAEDGTAAQRELVPAALCRPSRFAEHQQATPRDFLRREPRPLALRPVVSGSQRVPGLAGLSRRVREAPFLPFPRSPARQQAAMVPIAACPSSCPAAMASIATAHAHERGREHRRQREPVQACLVPEPRPTARHGWRRRSSIRAPAKSQPPCCARRRRWRRALWRR